MMTDGSRVICFCLTAFLYAGAEAMAQPGGEVSRDGATLESVPRAVMPERGAVRPRGSRFGVVLAVSVVDGRPLWRRGGSWSTLWQSPLVDVDIEGLGIVPDLDDVRRLGRRWPGGDADGDLSAAVARAASVAVRYGAGWALVVVAQEMPSLAPGAYAVPRAGTVVPPFQAVLVFPGGGVLSTQFEAARAESWPAVRSAVADWVAEQLDRVRAAPLIAAPPPEAVNGGYPSAVVSPDDGVW